jgi:ABC-type uncharacterized transport system substrate-binding protein
MDRGTNGAIEIRWAGGRRERVAEIAVEFVQLKVDVIATTGTAVPILKQATSVTPIVFAISNDMVKPVAFPPGRLRLATNPSLTGSPFVVNNWA